MTGRKRLAVVTGASTGVGRELAHICVEGGHDVLLCANEAALEQTAVSLRGYGGQAEPENG
ncbi:MAG: SDR family NAD(P)-dependent oxidoreductase [Pseudomonadota bacterium]|nr:SDR family NAD(P)-dependent oxidoreductase [Pseudomonadota bacterium]